MDYHGLALIILGYNSLPIIFQSCRETLSNIPSLKSTSGAAQLCQSDTEVWRKYGACLDGAGRSMDDRGLIWVIVDDRRLSWIIVDERGLTWIKVD